MSPRIDAGGGGTELRRVRGAARALACLGTALSMAFAAGCSSSSGGLAQPLPSDSTAPSSAGSPSTNADQEALSQYRSFWSVLPQVSTATASKREAMLSPFTANPELDSLLQSMRAGDRQGTVFYGHDIPRPTVKSLSVPQKVAVIRDCQDSSHSGNKDKQSGRRLTVGVARHLVIATMNLGPDDKWRVVSVSYEKSKC